MKKWDKKWRIARVVGRFYLTISSAYGISNSGFFHFPILFFACGKNGFAITILGIYMSVSIK